MSRCILGSSHLLIVHSPDRDSTRGRMLVIWSRQELPSGPVPQYEHTSTRTDGRVIFLPTLTHFPRPLCTVRRDQDMLANERVVWIISTCILRLEDGEESVGKRGESLHRLWACSVGSKYTAPSSLEPFGRPLMWVILS